MLEQGRLLEQGASKRWWVGATKPAVSLPELHRGRRVLERDPGDFETAYLYGHKLRLQGRTKDATAAFGEFQQTTPPREMQFALGTSSRRSTATLFYLLTWIVPTTPRPPWPPVLPFETSLTQREPSHL